MKLPGRLGLILFSLVFFSLSGFAGLFYHQVYQEYRQTRLEVRIMEERLASLEARKSQHREALQRLQQDPVFIERTIRRQLGYIRSDEVLYRFQNP